MDSGGERRDADQLQREEQHRGDDRRALVAVDEGMVAGEAEEIDRAVTTNSINSLPPSMRNGDRT